MSYKEIKDFKFDNLSLRGFIIESIDDIECDITDIEVVFQKNRAIVFKIIVKNSSLIAYLNKEKISIIKGKYYHYSFIATIDNIKNTGFHSPFFSYNLVVNILEFSKNNDFFFNSTINWNIEIEPTENFAKYLKRRKETSILNFNKVLFDTYNKKYRFLIDLYSFIYDTPILIEKVNLKNGTKINYMFQSQNINDKLEKDLLETYPFFKHGHFNCSLEGYLDKFVTFKKSNSTLDLLLKIYLIDDIFRGKENYNLNDISGLIDLFDGIFVELKIKLENINNSKTQRNKISQNSDMQTKVEYILDSLEVELKQYEIDKDKSISKILSDFRNMIRHQKTFVKYDLHKLQSFSIGILKLYVIKHILNISNNDYNIDRILEDFDIYSLVKHTYKYNDEEIVIYNTKIDNYGHQKLVENSSYFLTLKEQQKFKDSNPEDFIYDESQRKVLKKIYIPAENRLRRELIFFGIIINNNIILKSENDIHLYNVKYEDLKKELDLY